MVVIGQSGILRPTAAYPAQDRVKERRRYNKTRDMPELGPGRGFSLKNRDMHDSFTGELLTPSRPTIKNI